MDDGQRNNHNKKQTKKQELTTLRGETNWKEKPHYLHYLPVKKHEYKQTELQKLV